MSTRGRIAFNSNGELVAVDSNGNEILLATNEQNIGTELGIPIYSDPSNAPQTEGRIIYVDGNGSAAKGIYSHDGSSYSLAGGTGEWQENGSGNIVPIDGETVGDGTTSANHKSVSTDTATIGNVAAIMNQNGQSSDQSVPNNDETKITWFNQEFEDSTIASTDTNNDEIEILKSGDYQITAQVVWDGGTFSTGDEIETRIFLDGVQQITPPQPKVSSVVELKTASVFIPDVSANTKVDVRVIQQSGNSQNLRTSRYARTWKFVVRKVA